MAENEGDKLQGAKRKLQVQSMIKQSLAAEQVSVSRAAPAALRVTTIFDDDPTDPILQFDRDPTDPIRRV
jgi:hypothetical protein